jgi:hypothetical protein
VTKENQMALTGFSAIRKASDEITEKKNSGGDWGPKELWPALRGSGDSVQVRFLEQGEEVSAAYMHEYRKPGVNKSFFVPCLDQQETGAPCPACEQSVKRTIKGYINVIWRNSPQLKRGEDGRAVKNQAGQYIIEGAKDEVAVWVQGITVFEDLADKDVKYRGLSSRDFEITRRGTGLNTKYSIDPVLDADGNANSVPLTENDLKLAEDKYDVAKEYLAPLPYDEMAQLFTNGGAPSGGGVTEDAVKDSESPWERRARETSVEGRANRFLNS